MEKKPKILFEKCTRQFIETEFGLKRILEWDLLLDWLQNQEIIISENETETLQRLIKASYLRINGWNEETLKLNFISPVLSLIDFNYKYLGSFADEKLEVEFDNFILTGKADWMVAKGIDRPEIPYFFLHEYKRGKSESDPEGQLLAAMIAAQTLNKISFPIYGAVVIGSIWNFVYLENKQYDISKNYNSMDIEDLSEIVKILKKTQQLLTKKLEISTQ
jgi:hypothetical protein